MRMLTLLLGGCDVMDAAGGGAVARGTIQWSKLTMAIRIDGSCVLSSLRMDVDWIGLDWIGLD